MKSIFSTDETTVDVLKDKPLTYIKDYLDRTIVGEDQNKLALLLSKLTYMTDNPTHELIQGESGVGKTHLALGILDVFPEEDVIKLSRITGTWTDYAGGDLKHKILLLQQLGGLSSASDTIHILMSEKGLSLGTVRRIGGEWVSEKIDAEGPISLIVTTTNANLDPQMQSRTIIISPDESAEQTKAIQERQAHLDAYPWERQVNKETRENVRNLIRFLRDEGVKIVVVPYSPLVMLPNDVIRTRRDRPKILALVKSLAMLRQLKRSIFQKDGESFIVAKWEDCVDVLESCGSVISQTINQLSEAEVELLDNLGQWFGAMSFTVDEVQKHTPYAGSTVRMKLGKLREKGAISVLQGGGRSKKNQYSINSFDASPFLSELKTLDRSTVDDVVQRWKENLGDVDWVQNDE